MYDQSLELSFHLEAMTRGPSVALDLIHPSIVKPSPGVRRALFGTRTRSSMPSKLNAGPTMPAANVAPPSSWPSSFPVRSAALPSPVHQAIRPLGAGTPPGVSAKNWNDCFQPRTAGSTVSVEDARIAPAAISIDCEPLATTGDVLKWKVIVSPSVATNESAARPLTVRSLAETETGS